MRTLALVTPHQTGSDVKELQYALAHNRYGSFYKDPIDGEFGVLTAQAVYRAKYWLGVRVPTQHTNGTLLKYLKAEKPLTMGMRRRRRQRIKFLEKSIPLRVKALNEAKKHVGTKESPAGSNRQMFGEWYGWNGVAWCAIFVSYCYAKAGAKHIMKRKRWAYCPYIVADARAGRYGLSITTDPQPGDLVVYINSAGVAHHVGLFEGWIERFKLFSSIEGNTSPTNMSNGGEVYHYQGMTTPRGYSSTGMVFVRMSNK